MYLIDIILANEIVSHNHNWFHLLMLQGKYQILQFKVCLRNNNLFAFVIHKRSLNISEEYGCL